MYVCMCTNTCEYVDILLQHCACTRQRTVYWCLLSLLTVKVPRIELKSSELATSTFIYFVFATLKL